MTRHPRNVSFEWEPHRGPHRRLTEEQAEDRVFIAEADAK